MYLRTVKRKRSDGTQVAYLQLAHNDWDSAAGHSVPRVVHSFGRADTVDRDAIARLIGSLSRLLPPGDHLAMSGTDDLEFVESRPMGANYVLDGVWSQLGIDKTLRGLLKGRRLDPKMERVLFALVANRAVDPGSKLAATGWVTERTHIDGLADLDSDSCYRAMDWLLECETELAESIYWATADLLNLEVDLLFFDTTSTYFETPTADQPADGATVGFRTWGKSKDHRNDLPQIVIGMAVTRTGIPIRVWSWSGNTGDQPLIRQVKDDLADWRLGHVIWVADRGFSSAENRRYLQRAGGNYIIGEKIRGNTEAGEEFHLLHLDVRRQRVVLASVKVALHQRRSNRPVLLLEDCTGDLGQLAKLHQFRIEPKLLLGGMSVEQRDEPTHFVNVRRPARPYRFDDCPGHRQDLFVVGGEFGDGSELPAPAMVTHGD
jgi:hypothetical protein